MIPRKSLIFSISIFLLWDTDLHPIYHHLIVTLVNTLYLRGNYEKSFFFDPVTPTEIEREILSIPLNKAHGLYSCPNHILRSARYILSYPLAKLMNLPVTLGEYPSKLKHAKVIPVYKEDDETDALSTIGFHHTFLSAL